MSIEQKPVGERVTGLEVSVTALRSDLADLKASITSELHELQQALSSDSRTNWGVIMAGLLVAGSLYAAAIRPVETNVTRLEATAKTLADAVLEQNKAISESRLNIAIASQEIVTIRSELQDIKDYGSPPHERRISLIEAKLGMQQQQQQQQQKR